MDNAPEAVRDTVRRQIVEPLIEVLAGRLPVTQISDSLIGTVALRLAVASRKPKGRTVVRTVMVQALPGALEIAAVVIVDGRGHGLGIRVERRDDHPKVVRLDAPGLL